MKVYLKDRGIPYWLCDSSSIFHELVIVSSCHSLPIGHGSTAYVRSILWYVNSLCFCTRSSVNEVLLLHYVNCVKASQGLVDDWISNDQLQLVWENITGHDCSTWSNIWCESCSGSQRGIVEISDVEQRGIYPTWSFVWCPCVVLRYLTSFDRVYLVFVLSASCNKAVYCDTSL